MDESYIGLGQEHPDGVLQLSDTKAVLAFQHETNMIATMHYLTAAMVWWGEPIRFCILPTKGRHVRDYITMRGSCPSGTQTHVQGRREAIQSLLRVPSLDEELSEAQASMPQAELTRDV